MKFRPWIIPMVALVVLSVLILSACGSSTTTQTSTQTATQTMTQTTTTTGTTTSTATQTTTQTTTTTSTSATQTTATSTTSEGPPQTGGTLRIIWSTAPASGFGTAWSIFGGEGAYADMCMEPLMEGLYPSGDFIPRLATDSSVSADGKTVTFTLRQGVKFHDDTDFNADAVKYNVDKLIASGRASANLLGCDVIDNYTVQFNFNEGMNINFGSAAAIVIASPAFVETNGDTYAATWACGTGPYKQVAYEPNVKITFARFDNYWGQKGYLDGIESTFITDPVTQVMAMQAGQGDVTHSRQAKTMNDLKMAGFNVLQNFMGMEAMNYNSRDPDSPFYDVRVRQAFEYAINKEAIIKTLGYGYWEAAYQMPIPGMSGYLTDIVPRSYNPGKAIALLKDAGWGGGFDTQFVHGVGDFDDALQSMQADLKDVGINAELNAIQWSAWGATRQQGWQGVFVAGSGMIPDFNSLLWSYFRPDSTEMYSIVRHPEFTDMVVAAVKAIPKNSALTNAAAQYIYDQCLWAPIEHHGDNYAYTNKVHGLNFGTYGQWGAFDANLAWMSK